MTGPVSPTPPPRPLPPRPWEQPTPPQWPAVAEPSAYRWPAGTGPQAGHELITVAAQSCGHLPGDLCGCPPGLTPEQLAEDMAAAYAAWDAPAVPPPVGPGPLVDPALRDREVA